MRHHHRDFSAQGLLVELERGLALAAEKQIGIGLHDVLQK
jgi:hypothetical protein